MLAEEAIHSAIADYLKKQGKLSDEEIAKICEIKGCSSCEIKKENAK